MLDRLFQYPYIPNELVFFHVRLHSVMQEYIENLIIMFLDIDFQFQQGLLNSVERVDWIPANVSSFLSLIVLAGIVG